MREQFKTEAQAKAHRYGTWAGNPRGHAYDPKCCAAEFVPNERGGLPRQCGRRRVGAGLYCAMHDPDKVKAKAETRAAAYKRETAEQDAIQREARDLAAALGVKAEAVYASGPGTRLGGYVRRLAVSFDDARALAARLAARP